MIFAVRNSSKLIGVFKENLREFLSKIFKRISPLNYPNNFFYLGFLSRTFTIHRTAGEGGGYQCQNFAALE